MNLSTAGASRRMREVGIRKVMGSARSALVARFLVESVLVTALAMIVAIGLVQLALPVFNDLAEKELRLGTLAQPDMIGALAAFTLLAGLLAGSYPAFFLSSFKPLWVLKGAGHLQAGGKSIGLRSGLVVFQFFISFCLMVGATVVYRQLQYIQNKKLGYDKEQVLVVRETWRLGPQEALFRDRLLQDSRVTDASISAFLPAGPSASNNYIVYTDDRPTELVKTLRYEVDDRYIPTLGMEIVGGRNFSPGLATDSSAVVINETAVKAFGWNGENALDHTITRTDNDGRKATFSVIGIVRDFHFRPLHERISPLVMSLGNNSGTLILKARTRDLSGLLATVKTHWEASGTETPLDYAFLDESFQATYRAEQKTGRILGIFAGLTIFVACLGLLGLAIFTAEQRRREIGVRKVLGASATGIVLLLSRDFLKLVVIGMVLASPVAWYAMNRWLDDFAYKIDLEWWMFALAGLLAAAVALLTVSFQSVKAALANPVKSLRSE
jgi:putative ABC transport system permease protein